MMLLPINYVARTPDYEVWGPGFDSLPEQIYVLMISMNACFRVLDVSFIFNYMFVY